MEEAQKRRTFANKTFAEETAPAAGRPVGRLWPVLCLCILLGAGVLLFLRYFRVTSISVSGCSYYTQDQIEEMVAGRGLEGNTLYLWLKYKYFPPGNIPFIEKIGVDMASHNSIRITVYEKAAVACVEYMSEYLYFDKDGIVVESSSERIGDTPLVSGVNFKEMTLHEPLAVGDETIFKTILDLSQLVEYYKIKTDRIAFNARNEVTLYSGGIKVLLGKQDTYDTQLAELSKLLPEAEKKKYKGTLHMESFREGENTILKAE